MRQRRKKQAIPINEEWVAIPQTYRGIESYRLLATDGRTIRLRLLSPGRWTSNSQRTRGLLRKQTVVFGDLKGAAMSAIEKHYCNESAEEMLIGTVAGEWMKTLHIRETTRSNYDIDVRYFLTWAGGEGLVYWPELRLSHAQRYHSHLLGVRYGADEKPYSDKIVKDRLRVVKAMSKWASTNWGESFRDFAKGVVHRHRSGALRFEDLEEPEHLTFDQLYEFILWLWENEPERTFLASGAALQGFCGMRLTEVQRLTWGRVDLTAGRITIEGETKNRDSVRRLPIPHQVVDLLGAIPRTDTMVISYADRYTYSQRISAALKKWKPGTRVVPKDLRKSLPSQARDGGWYGYEVRQYLGHAPADITEAAYIRQTKAQQEELFRSRVVANIENHLDVAGGFRQCLVNDKNVVRLQEVMRRV